jgi:hypothetical protein
MYPFLGNPLKASFINYSETKQVFGGSGPNLVATPPTGVLENDLLLFFIFSSVLTPPYLNVTSSSGATKIEDRPANNSQSYDKSISVFYKYYTTSDTTYTFTSSENFSNFDSAVICIALRGLRITSPIQGKQYIGANLNTGFNTSPITVTSGSCPSNLGGIEIICTFTHFAEANSTWSFSTPVGFTQIYQGIWATDLTSPTYAFFYRENTTGGVLGNTTSTLTRSTGTLGNVQASYTLTLFK